MPPSTLTQADFLQLMVAQFTQQDPLASDGSGGSGGSGTSDYVNQLMSMTNLTTMQTMSAQQGVQLAQEMPGANVTVTDSSGNVSTGVVQATTITTNGVDVTVNGTAYPSSDITAVNRRRPRSPPLPRSGRAPAPAPRLPATNDATTMSQNPNQTIPAPRGAAGLKQEKTQMIQSLFAGVSGMLANQNEMDVIGNNIANANTTAFKASTADFEESFDQITRTATVNQPVGLGVGLGAQVSGTTTNFNQGVFQTTNVPTDMAINGSGFFAVQSVGGTNYVTRNGAFVEDSNGYLRTSGGDFLMGVDGRDAPDLAQQPAIRPTRSRSRPTVTSGSPVVSFAVDPTGAVTVTGQDGTPQVVGYITVQNYNNDNGLVDDGGGLYSYQAAAGTNQYFTGGNAGAGTIQTGVLEASNIDLSTEFANMIIAQRGFEAAARVITVSDNMLQTVTDLKTQ